MANRAPGQWGWHLGICVCAIRHVNFSRRCRGVLCEGWYELESPELSTIASIFRGRPVEEDAGAEEALNRAAAWVKNCMEGHEHCNASISPLSSRLLDLDCSSSPDVIKLWETEGAQGHYYAALSHC